MVEQRLHRAFFSCLLVAGGLETALAATVRVAAEWWENKRGRGRSSTSECGHSRPRRHTCEYIMHTSRYACGYVACTQRRARGYVACTQRRACGQMTIECAVCFPVLLALALVSYNAMSFICACSEFDRQFCEEVRIHATSLDAYSTVTSVCDDINEAMNTHYVPPENRIITAREQGLGIVRFTGEMIFEPTVFGNRVLQGMGLTKLTSLRHKTSLACSCMHLDAL